MNKISVIVIARNEEKRIKEALESVKWVDEIIVVDAFSHDKTVQIARGFTDKVFLREFDDFSAQKNFAVSQCSCPWVFSLDCDEVVSLRLRDAILTAINSDNKYSAYRLKRINKIFGKFLKYASGNDYPVRLFRKEKAVFRQPIHEILEVEGATGSLDGELLHHSTPDIHTEFDKTEHYTELEAKWLLERNIRPSLIKLIFYPPLIFSNIYLMKLGFLDGWRGFLFAYVSARYTFIKYLKARRLSRDQKYLEGKIARRFNDLSRQFPDTIDPGDSRLKRLLENLTGIKDKVILEVGCGKGRFTNEVSRKGAVCFGVDLSENFLKEAIKKNKGIFLKSGATALSFKDKSFDSVYAVEVIEHLPNLGQFIKESNRVIKNGGSLVIIDRNALSINNRRCLVPNLVIKKYHELKNDWMYPRGFCYREKWFLGWQVAGILKKHFNKVEYFYIVSDSEKKSKFSFLFNILPVSRHFILWKATEPKI